MTIGLGQSADPAALVPGDPGAVDQTARTLAAYGDDLHLAGAALARIDTTEGWRGQAADAFRRVYHEQPAQWIRAGDAFHEAASALAGYAAVLTWAQGQAANAIRVWQSGTAYHQAATQILDSARGQLDSVGNSAAAAVGRARDLAPPKPGFWSEAGSFFSRLGPHAEVVGAGLADGLLSLGNAAISHPGAGAAVAGGMLLAAISTGGDAAGFVLDATGVGTVAGVPLNAVSTAGIVAGAGISAAGLSTIISGAAGPQRVSIMNADTGPGSAGGEIPRSYSSSPGKIANQTGYTRQQITDAIHAVKNQPGWRGLGVSRNPDVVVDINTGEVYPEQSDGSPADDSIGNIYDYLPDEP